MHRANKQTHSQVNKENVQHSQLQRHTETQRGINRIIHIHRMQKVTRCEPVEQINRLMGIFEYHYCRSCTRRKAGQMKDERKRNYTYNIEVDTKNASRLKDLYALQTI